MRCESVQHCYEKGRICNNVMKIGTDQQDWYEKVQISNNVMKSGTYLQDWYENWYGSATMLWKLVRICKTGMKIGTDQQQCYENFTDQQQCYENWYRSATMLWKLVRICNNVMKIGTDQQHCYKGGDSWLRVVWYSSGWKIILGIAWLCCIQCTLSKISYTHFCRKKTQTITGNFP